LLPPLLQAALSVLQTRLWKFGAGAPAGTRLRRMTVSAAWMPAAT
jgi:hypothetical protein